ncbi:hypothetical protein [Pseudomonas aeruginosa]|uniref:hypothetical protein n=1 Tax=Pseudomonas aeruginosa TaxID=287 RepID=UPI000FC40F28|nr:hypothetical protein [Pseudomonas aeruginosa]RUI20259.1 hypothetical protein IPC443_23520 [Pseudomonas aeruginosa]
MKERPILFTGPMVRAILEGRKTVTRRAVKDTGFYAIDAAIHGNEVALREREALSTRCPFGQPGDRLWVREAWAADAQVDAIAPRDLSQGEPIWYPADFSVRQTGCSMISKGRGRPSIHMPRWASRILLEITAVRVECLHDISEEQAEAEGVERPENITNVDVWDGAERELFNAMNQPRARFRRLWSDINGSESWDSNPWVWVVEFKRVTP